MKYSLDDLIAYEDELAREKELDYIFWEAVFNSRFDMDSAGDRD
jgi:hypothetical protein